MLAQVRAHVPPVTETGLFGIGVAVVAGLMLAGYTIPVLLLAVLAPTAWACYRRPQRGLLIYLALLPFHGLLLISGLPKGVLGWKDYFGVALLVLTFLCPSEARAPAGRRLPGWVWAVAASMVLGLVSAAVVGGIQALVGLKAAYFGLVFALIVWRCPPNARERDALVTVFMAGGFVTALIGLWQQVVGYAYLAKLGYQYNEVIRFVSGLRLRSFSSFLQPFPFAFYLMIVMLVGIPAAVREPRRPRNRLFLLSLPVLGLALVLTYTRASFLGLGLGLAYLAFHRYKILVYLIPFAFLALLFVPGGNFSNALFQRQSLHARTEGWSAKIGRIEGHPLGAGLGSAGAAAQKTAKLEGQNPDLTYQPDNAYMKTLLELGVFGLWFQVLMLVASFLVARASERRVGGRDADLAAGIGAVVLASAAASLFATYFEIFPTDYIFWILITLASILPWQADARARGEETETVVAG